MSLLWTKWTTESVLCDIALLRRVFFFNLCYRSRVQRIYVFLNEFSSRAQKCHRYDENTIEVVFICSFPNISLSTLWSTKHAHACQQQDVFLILHDIFSSLLLNPCISNISNLYNPDKNPSLTSQTICNHIFSDPKLDHTFHVFWLCNRIIFCFFSYVEIIHFLWRREGFGIHCKLILDWI